MQKITSYTDLKVWQEGCRLATLIYMISSEFPKTEQFGITDQMRRAVVSIPSNIAEGFGRASAKEKTQFYYIAKGSLA
ncbi:four helix bundle protein [Candidatus Saccharibacteria bacterium]|nr:four helix bundle protein [Candidatus Saccharibacteria bacterium]NCU40469.1 four helix bundle protein [Candidatus Saccharibacteria bacterium]